MSKFLGQRIITTGSGVDGYSDHGLLSGLGDDDHLHYLITSAVRIVDSPTSGLEKITSGAGDVFSLINAGSGAALYIRQTGITTDADAAVDIDNTGNVSRGLSVLTETPNPEQPLVQFTALSPNFSEAVLSVIHASKDGLGLYVDADAYVSSQVEVGEAVTLGNLSYNPILLGDTGIYVENDTFYFVDGDGEKYTFNTVKVSDDDPVAGYLSDKLVAGNNVIISEVDYGGYDKLVISSVGGGSGDGYYPFIEVDELAMSGAGTGEIANTAGNSVSGNIERNKYNDFTIGLGTLEIRGLTLRSNIDGDVAPEITYDIIKDATFIDDNGPTTTISGGSQVLLNQQATVNETYISGNRKDGEVQFRTGYIDFGALGLSYADGDYFFIFRGNHTEDTKTVIIHRSTNPPNIETITFEYPLCSFSGSRQTAVRVTQTFDVEVTTTVHYTGVYYASAESVVVNAGGAVNSPVSLTETFAGSGIWTGTVTTNSSQGNGYADISVTATASNGSDVTTNTTDLSSPLVYFDNDFPSIEPFNELSDFTYPVNQTCLKFGEPGTMHITVDDFTEILYSSPTGRFTFDNPTTYEENKVLTWDQGSSAIEEPTANNVRVRARKSSNCSESNLYFNVELDDTPPRITSIAWRRNNVGSYNLVSPVLGVGVHGVSVVFDDPLQEIPEIIVKDAGKGTLAPFAGTVPGNIFYSTLTIAESDVSGCTELQLVTGINCSIKLPLDVDPINSNYEEFCIDVDIPEIIRVEIDVYLPDGYWNDGTGGSNAINDDEDNLDNTAQASEVDFSSGVQSITAPDTLTRHGEQVYVSVEVLEEIETGDTCVFDASPWGASSSLSVPAVDNLLYQGPFTTSLGSTRVDDQGRSIGRPSLFHATGNNATVTDLAYNNDTATNTDYLSANGIDDIGYYIFFTSDGTVAGTFKVSTDSFRAFMVGRKIKILDSDSAYTIRTVTGVAVDGTITCDGGSLTNYTTSNNARAVPMGVTDAEIQAWDANNGLVKYINDGAFTHLTLIDLANPEAFSQHLEDDQVTQNNSGTLGTDLFRANFWGSKISIPNTNGGTEDNPTGVANAKYVWRSKKICLTTNPTGVQGTNLRFMVFGFSAGTQYRNVSITSTSDWAQNSNKFNLGNNDSQIDIRISVDDFAATTPYSSADWYLTTDYQVSPQSGFKFGPNKDINLVFNAPSVDVIDKCIYIEVTLTTNSSGKAPQIDMIGLSYLT
jgi:hypothetical protein